MKNNGLVENPAGRVLSGGGAKEAYQAGVWKAICKCGMCEGPSVRLVLGFVRA